MSDIPDYLAPPKIENVWLTVVPGRNQMKMKLHASLAHARSAMSAQRRSEGALYRLDNGTWEIIWFGDLPQQYYEKPWNDALREKGYIK